MFRILLLAFILNSPGFAGIVLDVAVATPAAASSISTVVVSGRKADASDDDVLLQAANLAIDLGGDGFGLPAGFTFVSVSSSSFAATLNTAIPVALNDADRSPNFDALVNLNTGSVNIDSTNKTPLFELDIRIDGSVAPSTVKPLRLVRNASPGGFFGVDATAADGGMVAISTTPGSVSVVPEPDGIWFLAVALGTVACWLRHPGA